MACQTSWGRWEDKGYCLQTEIMSIYTRYKEKKIWSEWRNRLPWEVVGASSLEVSSQVGWGTEQPGLVEDASVHWRELEVDELYGFF